MPAGRLRPDPRGPRSLPPAALPKPIAGGLGPPWAAQVVNAGSRGAAGGTVMCHQWSWTPSLPSRGLQCLDAQLGCHQDTPQASAIAHQEPLPATCRILASGSISNLGRWVSPDTPLVKSNIHIKESAPLHGVQSHTPPRAPRAPASLACRFPTPDPLHLLCPLPGRLFLQTWTRLASPCSSHLSLPMCLPQGAVPELSTPSPILTPGIYRYWTPFYSCGLVFCLLLSGVSSPREPVCLDPGCSKARDQAPKSG